MSEKCCSVGSDDGVDQRVGRERCVWVCGLLGVR